MRLRGKRAVVTGGGTGIGAGIALRLVEEGAAVALIGRREAPLQATANVLRQRGGRAVVRTADVRDQAQVQVAFQAAIDELGGIDVLVNNAGTGGPNACALSGPDRWDDILRTNVDGVFHCTRAVLPRLPDGGRIVNISSVLGRFGVPGYTAYCASKHAVIGFTKALALELASRRITVNAICPGWVETEMAREGMQRMADAMRTEYEVARRAALSDVPLGRILQPEEIGATVVFLCSPDAAGFTGQAIVQDGGQVMW